MSQSRAVPSNYDRPYDPQDPEVQSRIHQKLIPFRDSPFRQPSEETRRALRSKPRWLELLFDLTWTLSFASLNEGTTIKGTRSTFSYSIFFILVWFMWAQQVIYHTRFYTDDAYHRVILVIQFLLFGFVAAFTADFDIGVGIKPYGPAAQDSATEIYQIRGFNALSLIFFISRFLLMAQYMDVWRYARKSDWKNPKDSALTMWVSTSCSATLFLVAFIIIEIRPVSRPANIAKFVLWALALLVESVAYIRTPMHRSISAKIMTSPMPERLCTLTIIIIGEALNSAADTIVSAARSPGFDFASGAEILALGLTILLVYVLYVSSFTPRPAPTGLRKRAVLGLHLPLHLFIILLLEGAKNILTIYTANKSLGWLATRTDKVLLVDPSIQDTSSNTANLFLRAGLNLRQLQTRLRPLIVEPSSPAGKAEESLRLTALVFQQVAGTFGILGEELDDDFTLYAFAAGQNPQPRADALAVLNSTNDEELEQRVALIQKMNFGTNLEASPLHWVVAMAGGYLILLAILMLVNGMPKIRWMWWQILNRVVVGSILILITIVLNIVDGQTSLRNWAYDGWYLPTILLAYILVYSVDYWIVSNLRQNVRAREALPVSSPDPEKRNGKVTDGIPLPGSKRESTVHDGDTLVVRQDSHENLVMTPASTGSNMQTPPPGSASSPSSMPPRRPA